MDRLAKAVCDVAKDMPEDEPEISVPVPWDKLQQAAEAWAVHSLRTYRGQQLQRALEISKAIAEFNCELMIQSEGAKP